MMITFKNYLTEILKTKDDTKLNTSKYLKHLDQPVKLLYYDGIHDHPDIKPQNLSDEQKNVIFEHTQTSRDYNDYLNKLKNNELSTKSDKFEDKIKKISGIFTPDNTNRKHILSYTGVPEKIGNVFLNSPKNSKHTLPRFTSTATNFNTALEFADTRSKEYQSKNLHILQCYIEPGASLSVAKHSEKPTENELLLNHGAHITYNYTTQKMINYKPMFSKEIPKKRKLYIHHVIVHNTHTPLEEYNK